MIGRGDWAQRTIELTALSLHLRELPAPGPPLMLLHGLGVDGTVWQASGRRFGGRFHLLAPDLRGHGQSGQPPVGYTARDYAADIAELLEVLVPEVGRVHLLGHSLGALAALGAAAMQPPGVDRLVLSDPPLAGPGPIDRYLAAVLAARGGPREALLAVVRQFQPELGGPIVEVQARMWEATAAGVLRAVLEQPKTVFDIDGWLARVPAPTLLLAADPARDARLGPEQAAEALAQLRNGRLITVTGAGHVIHAQEPAAFTRHVAAFLLP